ncbi:MAG: histidine kinase [Bacteroidales bacterium]|jgi:hypothetical protein|nr:histidine kinase [Bacteroidales bacterium]
MKYKFNPYSSKNALYISLAICLFYYLLIATTAALNYQTRSGVPSTSIISDTIISYVGSVILVFLQFKFSFWVVQKNMEPYKKHLAILVGLFLITPPLSFFFSYLYDLLLSNPTMYLGNVIYKKLMQDFIYAFVVFLITLSIFTILRGQKFEAESMRNRFEALKNQLDPHFLFNSLNTLDGLIGYDDDKAHDYLQNLSLTFRLILQNKELVELDEELKLVEAYAHLMKIRYGDSFILKYKIEDKYRSYLILQVSMQLLIENAVKHNAINDKYPLYLSIETTKDGTVKVKNNKSPKLEPESGTGIGLSNLSERYMLMFGKNIKTEDSEDVFSVEIPLIEQLEETTILNA